MAEFPALPLFTDAFIADTMHLNALQTGAYLMLLMCAWRTPDCRLPDDDTMLARFARLDLRTWKANRSTVMAFWKQDDQQKWYQARLVDERKFAEDKRSKNVAAGKASALKRHNSRSTDVQQTFNQNPTIPNPNPKEIDKSISNAREFDEFWKAYPSKVGKADAKKKFIAARRKTDFATIMASLERYKQSKRVKDGFVANPSTWLNQERWADEPDLLEDKKPWSPWGGG